MKKVYMVYKIYKATFKPFPNTCQHREPCTDDKKIVTESQRQLVTKNFGGAEPVENIAEKIERLVIKIRVIFFSNSCP
jgi:hypothetical protein